MQLTLFTDYALRSLMYLSWHPERLCTAEEIATFFGISQDHINKVLQNLARKGYVRSRRGRHGGVILARSADAIRLGEVLRDFEHIALLDCLHMTDVCIIEATCRLRHVLGEGQRLMMEYFDQFTLAQVAGPADQGRAGEQALVPVRVRERKT